MVEHHELAAECTESWVCTTPFGCPVVPDVYMMNKLSAPPYSPAGSVASAAFRRSPRGSVLPPDGAGRVGIGLDGVNHRRRRFTVDHDFAATVGQNEIHLRGRKACVEGDRHRPDLGCAIEQAAELDTIGHQ